MSKAKFDAAKQFIQVKQYDQARALLETIDHPTAAKWLAKLDEIVPKGNPKAKSKRRINRLWMAVLAVPLTCLIIWVLVSVMGAIGGESQRQAVSGAATRLISAMSSCSSYGFDSVKDQLCQQATSKFVACAQSSATFDTLQICQEVHTMNMCGIIYSGDTVKTEQCFADTGAGQ
jgi:hypothetical protein